MILTFTEKLRYFTGQACHHVHILHGIPWGRLRLQRRQPCLPLRRPSCRHLCQNGLLVPHPQIVLTSGLAWRQGRLKASCTSWWREQSRWEGGGSHGDMQFPHISSGKKTGHGLDHV